jgi:hypothetical protein
MVEKFDFEADSNEAAYQTKQTLNSFLQPNVIL